MIFFLLLGLVVGCEKPLLCIGLKNKNSGIIVSDLDIGKYLWPDQLPQDEYIITNDSVYAELLELIPNDRRDDKIPAVDFEKHTVLGKYASGGGCDIAFHRNVEKNNRRKMYVYTIKVKTCGFCEKLGMSMNWVLVPKLPEGYTVKFEVN